MTPTLVVTLVLGAVGSGGIGALVKLWLDRRDGSENRRVSEVDRIAKMLEKAEAKARVAERQKRILTEYVHDLRLFVMNQCNVPSSEIPEWPKYD